MFTANSSPPPHSRAAKLSICNPAPRCVRRGANTEYRRCAGVNQAAPPHFSRDLSVPNHRLFTATVILGSLALLPGCASIKESRGYVIDGSLYEAIQPGIDNQQSVEATLGRPTFSSQYGEPTWYYVSSTTGRRPFVRPTIQNHSVLAVKFDQAGNVVAADRTGMETVVALSPDSDETPTLGRERSFLEDLFGNIGTVGAPGAGPGGPGGPGGPR